MKSAMSCNIEDLMEDMLFGIFFSGYLGFDWLQLKEYALINKRFFNLARQNVRKLTIPVALSQNYCQNISTILQNVVYLDFDLSNGAHYLYSPETNVALARWCHSLKSIIFRGVDVVDDDVRKIMVLAEKINPTKPLTPISLDLSKDKVSNRPMISDVALENFISSKAFQGDQLRWLNLSMTNISDHGLRLIVSAFPRLDVLGIQCCPRITNTGLSQLSSMSLSFLDFSGCASLTKEAIINVFPDRVCQLAHNIKVLSCAHLPNFSNNELNHILENCPQLKRLDCRPRHSFSPGILVTAGQDSQLHEKAKAQLELFIFNYDDVAKNGRTQPVNIVFLHLNYMDHWAYFHWPYENKNIRKQFV